MSVNLPYDYERCTGKDCPARYHCARYTSPGRPDGWQEVSDPRTPGPDGCEQMIDNGRPKHGTPFADWVKGLE